MEQRLHHDTAPTEFSQSPATATAGSIGVTPLIENSLANDVPSTASGWSLDIKRSWNRQTPLYRLPIELLLSIFRLCLPGDEIEPNDDQMYNSDEYYMPFNYIVLLKLCSVSSDWACIIRNAPGFWVYTSTNHCLGLMDLILERSQSLPLWVEYRVDEGWNDAKRDTRERECAKAICKESHRWHTLDLLIFDTEDRMCSESLERLGAVTLPQLTHLIIYGRYVDQTEPFPCIFKCAWPALKYLQVSELNLDWDAWRFSNLEVLHLEGNDDVGTRLKISYPQLLNIIETSPSLKTLNVCSTDISGLPVDHMPTIQPSSVPILHKLRLVDLRYDSATPVLLSHVAVHTHNNSKVRIQIKSPWMYARNEVLAFALRRLSSLAPPTCPATLDIRIPDHGRGFGFDYGGDALSVSIWVVDVEQATDEIERVVQSLSPEQCSRPTVLSLSLPPNLNELMRMLSDRLNVVELRAMEHATVPTFGEILSQPHPTKTTWLFPGVGRLLLDMDFSFRGLPGNYPRYASAISKLAETRSGLAGTGEQSTAKLEMITLVFRDRAIMEEFECLRSGFQRSG
ncbi:hypothetical protein FRB99_005005 [Tulasnella sp. 403]|nr:hypothetical protein FRB99_005005 [Tulasnella sp. 403]